MVTYEAWRENKAGGRVRIVPPVTDGSILAMLVVIQANINEHWTRWINGDIDTTPEDYKYYVMRSATDEDADYVTPKTITKTGRKYYVNGVELDPRVLRKTGDYNKAALAVFGI